MIKAIIFDLDGLLIDSEPFWQEAEKKVLNKLNLATNTYALQDIQGMRTSEIINDWYQICPWVGMTKLEVINALEQDVVHSIRERGQAMPGVYQTLEFFQQQAVPMAIASSSASCIINAAIRKLNIDHFFSAICSGEDEDFGKPHPSVYLTASKRLECRPSECLVFEDSINGLIAAKAARMKVVAIPSASNFNRQEFVIADLKLKSLSQFSKEYWLKIQS